MNILKVLILVGLIGGGYNYYSHRHDISSPSESGISLEENENGFITLPPATGQIAGTVYVVAARNCPHDAAQRADRLAEALTQDGIPVQRADSIGFFAQSPVDSAVMDRMMQIMNGPLPIVFISGRVKSNPTLKDVVAEFKNSRL